METDNFIPAFLPCTKTKQNIYGVQNPFYTLYNNLSKFATKLLRANQFSEKQIYVLYPCFHTPVVLCSFRCVCVCVCVGGGNISAVPCRRTKQKDTNTDCHQMP